MKQQSERTLMLAGSLLLVGLIIADVLTQHLNQLELLNEETKSLLLVASSKDVDVPSTASKIKYEKQSKNKWDTRHRDKFTTNTEDTPISGLRNSKKQKTFLAEVTPPPPVQSNHFANDNELPFDQVGLEGKYKCVTSDIPQTQFRLFYNALNPHGRWFRHSQFGTCWIPQESQKNPQSASSDKENSKPNSTVFSTSLSEKYFVFLPKKHLLETSLDTKILNAEKARLVFQYSKPADRFTRGKDQRIGNHGIPANRLLPWMQTGFKNQKAEQKVSAENRRPQTSYGRNASSANAGRATYQKRSWAQSPLNSD